MNFQKSWRWLAVALQGEDIISSQLCMLLWVFLIAPWEKEVKNQGDLAGRGGSASTQQCKVFMAEPKTGNNSWRENGDRNTSFVSPWPIPPFHQKHTELSVTDWAAECPGIKSVRAKLLSVRSKPWQRKKGLYLPGNLCGVPVLSATLHLSNSWTAGISVLIPRTLCTTIQ